jgi:8-oxo-dGTP diphosphatase
VSRIRVAALALVRQDAGGAALLVVRKRGSTRFMLPGGKFEGRESDAACLARELREELALPFDPEAAVLLGRFEAQAANEPRTRRRGGRLPAGGRIRSDPGLRRGDRGKPPGSP